MGPVNLALWLGGIALVAVGYTRARGRWDRYQALKSQEDNVARYEAWRGGVRDRSKTGASTMMEVLRRQAQISAGIAVVGFVLIFAGFAIK